MGTWEEGVDTKKKKWVLVFHSLAVNYLTFLGLTFIIYIMGREMVVCCLVAKSWLTLCDPVDCSIPCLPVPRYLKCQASLSFTISWSLFKLMSIESVMPFNHFIFCRPLVLLPSIFPSIRVFSTELAFCIRWPKFWSFSFSISPSNEYSELISFRVYWLNLAVQGTLKSLLQHHS